jgi:hypothetical protein
MNNKQNNNPKNAKAVYEGIRILKETKNNNSLCPYCSLVVEFICVHGHYQCPNCKNIVVGCCGDN